MRCKRIAVHSQNFNSGKTLIAAVILLPHSPFTCENVYVPRAAVCRWESAQASDGQASCASAPRKQLRRVQPLAAWAA